MSTRSANTVCVICLMEGTKSDTHTQQQEKLQFFYTEYYPSYLELLDFWNVMSIFIISYYLTIFMIRIATCYCSSKRFIAYSKDLLAIFIHLVSSNFWRQEVKIIKFKPGMLIHIVWQRSGANRIRKRENTRRIPWSAVRASKRNVMNYNLCFIAVGTVMFCILLWEDRKWYCLWRPETCVFSSLSLYPV